MDKSRMISTYLDDLLYTVLLAESLGRRYVLYLDSGLLRYTLGVGIDEIAQGLSNKKDMVLNTDVMYSKVSCQALRVGDAGQCSLQEQTVEA